MTLPTRLVLMFLPGLCLASTAMAQSLEWVRFSSGEEGASSFTWDVAVDQTSNLYVVGGHQGSIDLSGDGIPDLEDRGYGDILLAKYNIHGLLQWAISPGGAGNDQGRGVATDANGNVYITGYVQEDADFDGVEGSEVFVTDFDHLFLAKFDAGGTFQWVRSFCGRGESVATDPAGGVYVAGVAAFCAGLDGDGTADVEGRGAILARYTEDGTLEWYRFMKVGFHDVFGVAVAGTGDVHLTGSLDGSVDFDGDGHHDVHCANSCMFVTSFERGGTLKWLRTASSSSGVTAGYSVAATASGTIIVTGVFEGDVDFSGDGITDVRSAGNEDAFVASYNPDGSLRWVDSIGGQSWDEGLGVATTADKHYVTGMVDGRVDLDGNGTIDTPGGRAIYIVSYDADGAIDWVQAVSGTGWSTTHGAIAVTQHEVFIGGSFFGTIDLDADGVPDAGPGDGLFVGQFSIKEGTAAVREGSPTEVAGSVILSQNYPNPFMSSTRIEFSLHEAAWVTVSIYDSMGRRVAVLADEMRSQGTHQIDWQPGGSETVIASGIYVYRLTAGSHYASRIMFFVR